MLYKRKPIHTTISQDTASMLDRLSSEFGMPLGHVIDMLVKRYRTHDENVRYDILNSVIEKVLSDYYSAITKAPETHDVERFIGKNHKVDRAELVRIIDARIIDVGAEFDELYNDFAGDGGQELLKEIKQSYTIRLTELSELKKLIITHAI